MPRSMCCETGVGWECIGHPSALQSCRRGPARSPVHFGHGGSQAVHIPPCHRILHPFRGRRVTPTALRQRKTNRTTASHEVIATQLLQSDSDCGFFDSNRFNTAVASALIAGVSSNQVTKSVQVVGGQCCRRSLDPEPDSDQKGIDPATCDEGNPRAQTSTGAPSNSSSPAATSGARKAEYPPMRCTLEHDAPLRHRIQLSGLGFPVHRPVRYRSPIFARSSQREGCFLA